MRVPRSGSPPSAVCQCLLLSVSSLSCSSIPLTVLVIFVFVVVYDIKPSIESRKTNEFQCFLKAGQAESSLHPTLGVRWWYRGLRRMCYIVSFYGSFESCTTYDMQAKTVVAPLDRVKILFQASNPDFHKYAGKYHSFHLTRRTRTLRVPSWLLKRVAYEHA